MSGAWGTAGQPTALLAKSQSQALNSSVINAFTFSYAGSTTTCMEALSSTPVSKICSYDCFCSCFCLLQGKCADNAPLVVIHAARGQVQLASDLMDIADRISKDFIPASKDDRGVSSMDRGVSGLGFGGYNASRPCTVHVAVHCHRCHTKNGTCAA